LVDFSPTEKCLASRLNSNLISRHVKALRDEMDLGQSFRYQCRWAPGVVAR